MEINSLKRIIMVVAMVAVICFQNATAQNTVKGVVVDSSSGEKFAGASITLLGTSKVAMSDDNGAFELVDVNSWGVLEVVAPGCELQYVPLQGKTDITVLVVRKSLSTPLYNEQSMSPYVSDVVDRTCDGITAINEDMNMLLSGTMRNILQSGIDATGSTMFIRGMRSINMTSQPLYIVDGIQWQTQDGITSLHEGYFTNPLAFFPPEDIENIQILKNGTALYGAKAANGVVIINTKRAHNMATEIAVNISVGLKSPFNTIPMMDATDYRIYATEVMRGMDDINDNVNKFHFLDDDRNGYYYLATHNNTDWLRKINKTAFTQNYGISVKGGDEVALYYFSLDYTRNNGNVESTNFDRLNVRFNSDINFTKKLTARADIAFTQITRNIFDDGINAYTSPTYLAYIKSPLYNPYQFDATGNLFDKISDKDELSVGNPLAITNNAEGGTKNYRFVASLQPKYQFTDRFALSATAGIAWDKIKENSFIPDFGLDEVQLYNEQGDWYGEGDNSVASLMTRNITLTLGMNADWRMLKGKNNLNLMGGITYINNVFECDYGSGYNTGSDYLKSLDVTSSSLRSEGGFDQDWRIMSWHVVADYNFLNRYFLSASLALESSSRLGKKADTTLRMCGIQWGLFPSINAAWIISNEKFMKHVGWIDYLRLHIGYDMTGNDDIPIGVPSTYFSSANVIGLAKGLVLSNVGNEELTWEKTTTANVGFDINLLHNRLSINTDFYYSNTTDLLVQKNLPQEFGLESYWTNDGRVVNIGFNVGVNARVVDHRTWKFNVGITVGHYKNEVKALGSGSFTTTILDGNVLTSVGNPLGVFYGYKTLGVFSTQEESEAANLGIIANNGQKISFGAGDMHFCDTDNNGIIDEQDMEVIGDPNPDIYGNFNLNLQYKQFSLSAIFTYSLGNDAYNALRASLESGSSMYNQTVNMLNRWSADGQITSVPRATYDDPMGNSRFSDRWIEDASFLKLKQISVSYNLPIKPRFIQGLQLWVAIDNVFTITKYLGMGPEFSYGSNPIYQGIDAGLTPSTRSYNIGIRLNL